MRKRVLLGIVILLFSVPALAGFREGYYAYHHGDYAKAAKEFRPLAESGLANAQYFLGVMYENGQGVPKDYEVAYRWYVEAAYQGHVPAQNNLGALYEEGQGVKQNYPTAVLWYQLAADGGSAKAQFNLAEMYVHGRGGVINADKARFWYYQAAGQGHKKAMASLLQFSQTNMSKRAENTGPPEKETSIEPDSRTDFERTVYKCTKQVQSSPPSHQFEAYAEGSRVRYLGTPDAYLKFETCMSKNGHPLTDK
jgi:TPR repeat protein